jgi:hypothetical protein
MDQSKACGPPPPVAVYTDLSTAITTIQGHAKANGYALFKRDSKPRRIVYACDRYGKPQTSGKKPNIHESKQREGRTKKCDCKMRIALEKDMISGQWELVILEGSHNHESSAAPSAHPAYRIAALDNSTRVQIENLALAGLSTQQILSVLRQEKSSIILAQKDISNLVQAVRLRQIGSLSSIQWLLKECLI